MNARQTNEGSNFRNFSQALVITKVSNSQVMLMSGTTEKKNCYNHHSMRINKCESEHNSHLVILICTKKLTNFDVFV